MEITIKRFNELTIYELQDILALRSRVFVVEQKCIYNDVDLKDSHGWHLMQRDDDKSLASYLRILDRGQTFPDIAVGRVATAPEYRRRGLADKSMSAAIKFIEKVLDEKTIRIEAQSYLVKFYESFGFKICSEEFLDEGIPHVEMVLKL